MWRGADEARNSESAASNTWRSALAFTCTIAVPATGSAEQAVVRWLVQEGALMEPGDAIFLLTQDGQTRIYEIAMPCTLSEKLIDDGSTVRPDQPVAFASVEDADIPRGRPFVAERPDESSDMIDSTYRNREAV
jgi:pyruvate/2-oxoglutarate dehydrogenase complex dihydrolipoamide acyltransferase (E2) component